MISVWDEGQQAIRETAKLLSDEKQPCECHKGSAYSTGTTSQVEEKNYDSLADIYVKLFTTF